MNALLLAALILALPAGAETTGSTELWGYGTVQDRFPGLPDPQWTGEARINLRLTSDSTELVLRPRLLYQHDPGASADPDVNEAYLSQAFARIRLNDALVFTGGRELLTWGPGNFRSPSNPLYFDAGRTDPLRDVSGVDLARLTWTRGPLSLMLAREQGAGHQNQPLTPDRTTLAKLDLRGRDGMLSVILATPVWGAPFYGGFAQATLGEAWMVYGEIGSGQRPAALDPADDSVRTPSPRRSTTLLGVSYTLPKGQSIGLEGLRDGHGYTRQGEALFFAHAAPDSPLAPALLGRDYGSLLWQSNPQESGHYWRLMWTANAQDRSSQVSAYVEKSFSARFTAFGLVTHNLGGAASEFGSLFRTSLTLGIKCFAF